jgi:two-component system chemotaxis sensor kinase CheA
MDDLIAEFLTETNESLESLDADLVTLEQNPNDMDLLSRIFRLMHTIKGTCGFLGLPRLETVAHRAENVLGLFRDGVLKVTPDYVTLIFESIDRIKTIIAGLEEAGSEPQGDDSGLIARLDHVYESRGATGPEPEMPDFGESASVQDASGAASESSEGADSSAVGGVVESDGVPHDEDDSPRADAKSEGKGDGQGAPKESAVSAQSLRVNVETLENLMTLVSELVLTRNQLLQILRAQKDTEFTSPLQRLNHVVSDLQEGVMKTRMQPIGNAWSKLPRIIRDISVELGKKVDLQMIGQETELDRQVLDMIKDPLTHMVRNSADHGIESPADRAKAGKPETGTIVLHAYHEGGHILIEISDDGKGLSTDRIRKKILEKGLATPEELASMSMQQVQQFIFRAGFSTAEKVTSVSGRGVGMDVVRTNIEKIGGSIELKSVEGKGTKFIIKIPLTLAIVSALIVEAGGERFAIPQLGVRELVMASHTGQNRIETIKGAPVFRLRDHLLPLVTLKDILGLGAADDDRKVNRYIVVTQVGGYLFGIIVDRVFDTEEIVVKPVAGILKDIEIFSGNTILGDGSVIMILDPAGIAKMTGEVEAIESGVSKVEESRADGRQKTSLLLFRAGYGAPKAVPLSLVSRLENIKTTSIEHAGNNILVQYRGQLMPLVPFDSGMDLHGVDERPILVFTDGVRSMGLVVEEIVDILEEYVDVQIAGSTSGLLGSAIISGKATDVIDVGYYIQSVNRDWFKTHGDDPFEKDAGRRRVLLVDDSPFFRNMLTPLLSVAGYDVTTLESPVAALKLCDEGRKFDIIVSDIEMPDMNGFQFAEKVRSGSQWQATPMVALTSHATPQDVDRGRAAGFSNYIAKFDRDTLLNALAQTLAEYGEAS